MLGVILIKLLKRNSKNFAKIQKMVPLTPEQKLLGLLAPREPLTLSPAILTSAIAGAGFLTTVCKLRSYL